MYDDITYSKDDIYTHGTDVLECVTCMTTFRGGIKIFRNRDVKDNMVIKVK